MAMIAASVFGIPAFIALESGGVLASLPCDMAVPPAILLLMPVIKPAFKGPAKVSHCECLDPHSPLSMTRYRTLAVQKSS